MAPRIAILLHFSDTVHKPSEKDLTWQIYQAQPMPYQEYLQM